MTLSPDEPYSRRRVMSVELDRRRCMKSFLSRFFSDESGATAIEYGLIAAGIAVTIITIVATVGTDLSAKFTAVDNGLK